eukprot:TRINITY_DN6585_c0_g2_i4.p3 TRINITY_DN6585_c0_g2~~TRINITY_DN6585_c0_g2_i4.p3  ORF type:complete len:160 (-),score=45.33 TRINITY_DN6585_c0_g2_i4:49-528(-)
MNVSVHNDLKGQMRNLVVMSMQAVRKKLNAERHSYCFEIFGYDFVVDAEFKVWLIEVNTNPCLEESSCLLKALLPRMIDDAFKLTIDSVFLGKRGGEKAYGVEGYEDGENMWEFLQQIVSVDRKKTVSNIARLNQEADSKLTIYSVSYTHLTLPTSDLV